MLMLPTCTSCTSGIPGGTSEGSQIGMLVGWVPHVGTAANGYGDESNHLSEWTTDGLG